MIISDVKVVIDDIFEALCDVEAEYRDNPCKHEDDKGSPETVLTYSIDHLWGIGVVMNDKYNLQVIVPTENIEENREVRNYIESEILNALCGKSIPEVKNMQVHKPLKSKK